MPVTTCGQLRKQREEEETDRYRRYSKPNKKRKLAQQSGLVLAARDPADPQAMDPSSREPQGQQTPSVDAPPATGLPTPAASSLTEPDSKKAFPFLRLPAELRVEVYRHALCSEEPLSLNMPQLTKADDEDKTPNPNQEYKAVKDPYLNVALLLTCSLVYKEARKVLYSENEFTLSKRSSINTLGQLHQRSRSLIKFATLSRPSKQDLSDICPDIIRLGLRYCWGLQKLTLKLDLDLPNVDHLTSTYQDATYVRNVLQVLRWLPQKCKVDLEGCDCDSVKRAVAEEARLLVELDEVSYIRRQHGRCDHTPMYSCRFACPNAAAAPVDASVRTT